MNKKLIVSVGANDKQNNDQWKLVVKGNWMWRKGELDLSSNSRL